MTTTGPQRSATTPRGGVARSTSVRFRAPVHVHNVIERRRVLDRLRGSAGRQLTVIHAPAGYGKTTLAVQWLDVLQNAGASVAWLGLHRDDNAPHWFLTHLLEAVRRALPGAGEAIDDLLEMIEQSSDDAQGYCRPSQRGRTEPSSTHPSGW